MNLATARRISTHVAVLAAFWAMASGGDFPPTGSAVFAVAVVASLLKGDRQISWLAPTLLVASAGSLVVLALAVAQGGLDLVVGAAIFAAVVTANRVLARKSAADDPLLFLTTLLMLAAGAALSGELAYGLGFAVYAFAVVLGLTFSHLELSADAAGVGIVRRNALASRELWLSLFGLAGVAMAGAGLFFVTFPRVNARWFGRHAGVGRDPLVGFSDQVRLGGYGALRSDPRPALRVTFPDKPDMPVDTDQRLDLLWRGQSLDRFDGKGWNVSPGQRDVGSPIPSNPARGSSVIHAHVEVLPVAQAASVFSPGEVLAVRLGQLDNQAEQATPHRAWRSAAGDATIAPRPAGYYAYDVWARPSSLAALAGKGRSYTELVQRMGLQLPEGIDPRIGQLAERWSSGLDDPLAIAVALRDHLKSEYRYTTELPGEQPDPLAHFLFERKEGHCEFFSTALAVLLRTRGIPAREVTGFSGGRRAPASDVFLVRAGDAHSWVEVFFPGVGWMPFDATPDAFKENEPSGLAAAWAAVADTFERSWRANVIDYDLMAQLRGLQSAWQAVTTAGERFRREPDGSSPEGGLPTLDPMRLAGLALLLIGVGFAFRAWRRRRNKGQEESPATAMWSRVELRARRKGAGRRPSETAREWVQRLQRDRSPVAAQVQELAALYEAARFGGIRWGADDEARIGTLLAAMK